MGGSWEPAATAVATAASGLITIACAPCAEYGARILAQLNVLGAAVAAVVAVLHHTKARMPRAHSAE